METIKTFFVSTVYMNQKNNILKQGFLIIAKDGIRSFTVDRLSSMLRISKKTIYAFFATKEILIDKIIKSKLYEIDKVMNDILVKNDCPIKCFHEINRFHIKMSGDIDISKLIELKVKYPFVWSRIEKHRKNELDVVKKIIKNAKLMNYLRCGLDSNLVSKLYINIIDKTFQPEFFIQQNMTYKETINLFADIMANGIFNDRGLKLLEKIGEENI
jgi:AcrR family transcriptional regulator